MYFIVPTLSLIACDHEIDHHESIRQCVIQLKDAQSLSYDFSSEWDNRFNETVFRDSAKMILSRLESEEAMYGIYAKSKEGEYIFSGDAYFEVLHEEEKIIYHQLDTIYEDPKEVVSTTFLMYYPLDIIQLDNLKYIKDTIIDYNVLAQYRITTTNPSKVDSALTMTYHTDHFLDLKSSRYNRVVATSIKSQDTLQVITTKFENLNSLIRCIDLMLQIDLQI